VADLFNQPVIGRPARRSIGTARPPGESPRPLQPREPASMLVAATLPPGHRCERPLKKLLQRRDRLGTTFKLRTECLGMGCRAV
jgi:hypothetical protein